MKRSPCGRSRRASREVLAMALVAALMSAPAAVAAPSLSGEPPSVSVRLFGSWLAKLLEHLFPEPMSIQPALGAGMDPDGAPSPGSTSTVEAQDGETCDPTKTELGCGMDPDG